MAITALRWTLFSLLLTAFYCVAFAHSLDTQFAIPSTATDPGVRAGHTATSHLRTRPDAAEVIALGTARNYRFKGLAVDATTRTAYLGSWDKKQIVAVSLVTHSVSELYSPFQGRLNGMGTYIKHDRLYAVMNEVNDAVDLRPTSALLVYDLDNNGFSHSYTIRGDENGRHHFNHMVVADDGLAYISDTLKSSIYTVNTKTPSDSLRPLVTNQGLSWVHGLDLSSDQKRLFVTSYTDGIGVIDIAARTYAQLATNTAKHNDGLRYFKGTLYAIGRNTLTRYSLNEEETAIVGEEIVLRNHTFFNDPRCLDIVDGWLYILGNIEHTPVAFDDDEIQGMDLNDTYILKLRIEN